MNEVKFNRVFEWKKGDKFQGWQVPNNWKVQTDFVFTPNFVEQAKKENIDLKKLAFSSAWKHHLIEDNIMDPATLKPILQVKHVTARFVSLRRGGVLSEETVNGLAKAVFHFFVDPVREGLNKKYREEKDLQARKNQEKNQRPGGKNIDYGCVLPGVTLEFYVKEYPDMHTNSRKRFHAGKFNIESVRPKKSARSNPTSFNNS